MNVSQFMIIKQKEIFRLQCIRFSWYIFRPLAATSNSNIPDNNFKRISVYETSSSQEPISMNWKRASTGSVILGQAHAPEPVIVHAGAIISMLHLVPALVHDNTQVKIAGWYEDYIDIWDAFW